MNDKTLIHGACKKAPNQGVDICRVVEGSEIDSDWNIFLPWAESAVQATVRVRYKDRTLSFKFADRFATIPFKEVIGRNYWGVDDDGPVQALATIEFDDGPGQKYVQALGYAYIIVLRKGYTPLPLNDSNTFGELNCKMQFTDSGRSNFTCSPQ